MSEVVQAVFVDGVFKPEGHVDLPENARVQLVVQPLAALPDQSELDADWREFEALLDECTIRSTGPLPTRDELHERR